jgi:lipopolysaccharide export system permease protein
MTRLDRYVGRIVLGAFVAALLFFVFLAVLVDLLNNLPRYADRAAEQGLGGVDLAAYLLLYYGKLTPVLVTTVTPFAAVIAGMFSVARLHHANEIVPMLFVGRSIHRVLQPILWCGVLGGVIMASSWQWVVPHVGAALASDETFLRQGSTVQKALVHESHAEISQYFYVREFHPLERRIVGAYLLAQGDLASDVALIRADEAVWDDTRGDWRLVGGVIEKARSSAPQEWLERPDLTPALLLQQSRDTVDPETMSYTELLELSAARPNRPDLRLALHRHVTYPLSCLLLLLLALPMAVRYERGSRIDRILTAIALCGGYMLVDLTCQSMGTQRMLHPVVAAWTPTILFGSLGIVLYGGTRT